MRRDLRLAALVATTATLVGAPWWSTWPGAARPKGPEPVAGPAGPPRAAAAAAIVAVDSSRPATAAAPTPGVEVARVGSTPWSGRPVAWLRLDGAPPRRLGVGDAVAPGVRLVRIEDGFVELDDHGRRRRVDAPREVQQAAAAARLEPAAGPPQEAAAQPESDVVTRSGANAPVHTTTLSRAIDRARGG